MKKLLSLLVVFLLVNTLYAQQPAKEWTKKFPGNVKWCQGNSMKPTLDDVKEENYDPIEGTPYAALIKNKFLNSTA